MRYSKYPSYRDSGVEWLGEIPECWDKWKLNHFTPIITCGVAATPEYVDSGIKFLSAQNIINNKVDLKKGHKYITEKRHAELTNIRAVKNGDLLMSRVGTIGNTCIVDVDFDFSIFVSLTHLRLNNAICNNMFFVYLTESQYFKELNSAETLVGGGVGNLNVNDLREYQLPLPPLQEQQTIANYLDKATAKIDTLIEKQTKLIELLREKRQAVISTAVTRGLDNTVAMKDSGVEWLGEIPEHWTRTPLRYIGRLQNGISKGGDYFGSGFPFVNYGDIYKNGTLPPDVEGLAKSTKEDQQIYSVKTGDVFFTRTSETIDDIGMASTCVQTIEYATFSGFTIRFRQLKRLLNEHFSKYYFRTGHAQAFFEEQLNLVTRASLGQDILKQLPVLIPPLEEQQTIADYLDDKTSKIDTLITKSTKAIDLLKEKRTALISAAVTGKIDVREIA